MSPKLSKATLAALLVALAMVSMDGQQFYIPPAGGGAPAAATFITQTASTGLSAEQALATLASGILKSTTTTGVLSIAIGADIPAPGNNTECLYNKAGVLGADAGCTYAEATDIFRVGVTAGRIGVNKAPDYSLEVVTDGAVNYAARLATSGTLNGLMLETTGGSNANVAWIASNSGGLAGRLNWDGTGSVGTSWTSPILYGSSAANGGVIVEGTSSATKTESFTKLQPTGGWVFLGPVAAAAPAAGDCDDAAETNRIIYDSTGDNLYICSGASGWRKIVTAAP